MQMINVIELIRNIQNPPYTICSEGERCEWVEECIEKTPITNITFCEECMVHGGCYIEDTFASARLESNQRFCGVGKKRMEVTKYEP